MKILLISPPTVSDLMKNARCDFVSWSGCQWWPMILGQLGSYLQSKGHEVKLVDAQAAGLSHEETRAIISDYDPDFSVVLAARESLSQDITWAMYLRDRKEEARACLISPFFLAPKAREISKNMGVDWIAGEPEKGVEAWISGAAGFIEAEQLTEDEYRKWIGWPSKFMAEQCGYSAYMAPSEPHPFIDVLTSRGCSWGRCTFCLWPKTYRCKHITRDMNDVMDEISWIEGQGIFKGIMIEDDTLPDWRAMDFAMSKIKRGLKISWSCLVRGDLKPETLKLMKESGCLNLHVGFESASDKTLKRIKKGLTVKEMDDFAKAAKAAGLRIHGDFMIGIDETEAEIYETIGWACRMRPETAQFQIYIPYMPDTPRHDPERLKELAKMAYKKFYGNPLSWPAVVRQLGKPRVIGRSLKKVAGL
jgi:hypothetical protein